ncbi:MAG: hypothetical protein ABIC82_02090 [bacterium]
MLELFLKLIEQLNSSVFVLLAILVLAFWAIYKIAAMVTLFGGFKEERAETKKDLTDIKKDVAKVTATVDLLYQSHLYQNHLPTVKSYSPLSLTDKGKDISDALKLEGKVASHWSEIKSKIEEKNLSNPYDIQTASLDLARDCFETIFTNEERNEMKQYAFKNGLNILEFFPIIGIITRDKFLTERGINLSEVDEHDPK